MATRLSMLIICVWLICLSACSETVSPSKISSPPTTSTSVNKQAKDTNTSAEPTDKPEPEDNRHAKLIIGKWQLMKMDKISFPIHAVTIVFEDKRFLISDSDPDSNMKSRSGTYSLDRDKIIFELDEKITKKNQIFEKWDAMIEKLTDDELITRSGSPPGQLSFFKKVEDKKE